MDVLEQYKEDPRAAPWGKYWPDETAEAYAVAEWLNSIEGIYDGLTVEAAAHMMVAFNLDPSFEEQKGYTQYAGTSELEEEYQKIVVSALEEAITHDGGKWRLMGFIGPEDPLQRISAKGKLTFSFDAYYWWWRAGGLWRAVGAKWYPMCFNHLAGLTTEGVPQEVKDALVAEGPPVPAVTAPLDDIGAQLFKALESVTKNHEEIKRILAKLPKWIEKNRNNAEYHPWVAAALLALIEFDKRGIKKGTANYVAQRESVVDEACTRAGAGNIDSKTRKLRAGKAEYSAIDRLMTLEPTAGGHPKGKKNKN